MHDLPDDKGNERRVEFGDQQAGRDIDRDDAGDGDRDGDAMLDFAPIGEQVITDDEPADPRTLVVVLAAGAGSRFSGDTHKLQIVLGDRTVAEHSIIAAIASGVGDVVVITGASRPDPATMSALAREHTSGHTAVAGFPGCDDTVEESPVSDSPANDAAQETVQFIHNDCWADGQASSLQVALRAATAAGVDAMIVGLADQPGVTPEAWRRVAASQAQVAVATYNGVRGNPVRLHRSIWHLLPTTGDEGARPLIRLHPELVQQIPCPGSAHDIDTREDLQLWQSRSSTSSQ